MKAQLTIPGPRSVTGVSARKGEVALAEIQSRNIVFILEGRSSLMFNPTYPRSGEQEALRQHPLTGDREVASGQSVCSWGKAIYTDRNMKKVIMKRLFPFSCANAFTLELNEGTGNTERPAALERKLYHLHRCRDGTE